MNLPCHNFNALRLYIKKNYTYLLFLKFRAHFWVALMKLKKRSLLRLKFQISKEGAQATKIH